MDILLKLPYGRWKPGRLLSSRRTFYEKLFAEGKCWPESEVENLRKKWFTLRPRPKSGFGPWAHAYLEAQFGETEPNGTGNGKPTPPRKEASKKPATKKAAKK